MFEWGRAKQHANRPTLIPRGTAQDWLVVVKTTVHRYLALEALLRKRHSYEVSEVICAPSTDSNPTYLAWVSEETGISTGTAPGLVDS
ncbi:hypothetical protein GCM10010124_22480 [Pilimelia terevasa]|uniref:Divalent-cation tolerance protein CutA n=1 Tax=Pilimelia terevasa TaxID=53372 RepID=A0A8J3FIC7_9ACTN|nr:divalent cation tolerance protein CutA [Pilimelia terevasa]GGK29210.1 hypothetical protein GCM10010124_22480 [Pilimelia terevasa]